MLRQTTTHASLLARLADGQDADAWRDFEGRYGELIRGFARRRGLQNSDADDVLQEVLMAVSRNLPGFRYDPARGRFRGYLKTIALRAISKKMCQSRGEAAQELLDEQCREAATDPEVEELWESEWRQYHLRTAMEAARAAFNDTDLAAFDAYAGKGRAAEDVAAELGVSVDSVYQAKSRILRRLRESLAKTGKALAGRIRAVVAGKRIDAATLDGVEEALLAADVGVEATAEIMDRLRAANRSGELLDGGQAIPFLKEEMARMLAGDGREIARAPSGPTVVLVCGVNGSGKTTSVAKLAGHFLGEGRSVVLAACDTFRAAAVEQLSAWGARVGVPVVKQATGADPAAVAYGKPFDETVYEQSRFVSEPYRLHDCSRENDGGVAVIMTSAARAAEAKGAGEALSLYEDALRHFLRFRDTLGATTELLNNLGVTYTKLALLETAGAGSPLHEWATDLSVERELATVRGELERAQLECNELAAVPCRGLGEFANCPKIQRAVRSQRAIPEFAGTIATLELERPAGERRSAQLRVAGDTHALSEPGALLPGLGIGMWRPEIPAVIGEVVGGIVGVRVRETVPDRIFLSGRHRGEGFEYVRGHRRGKRDGEVTIGQKPIGVRQAAMRPFERVTMHRIVALKVLAPELMKTERARTLFEREVRAAAKLVHQNIVTAYDSGEVGNVKYLVMQFVDGGDLSSLVKKNGPLSIEQACDYVRQAACGLAYAHGEGVIHLSNADYLTRPLRLAADEALALVLALRTLREVVAGTDRRAIDSALVKLEAATGSVTPSDRASVTVTASLPQTSGKSTSSSSREALRRSSASICEETSVTVALPMSPSWRRLSEK